LFAKKQDIIREIKDPRYFCLSNWHYFSSKFLSLLKYANSLVL